MEAALANDIPIGGYCPKGRVSEDGVIPERYPMEELPTGSYPARTRANVKGSCGTLIITVGEPSGGTALTIRECKAAGKPFLVVRQDEVYLLPYSPLRPIIEWILANGIKVLNVAGPRESKHPGIQEATTTLLSPILRIGADLLSM